MFCWGFLWCFGGGGGGGGRKASMLSALFLRRFPKFSFETVLVFVGNKAGILYNIYNLL